MHQKCHFTFINEIYIQKYGVAMGFSTRPDTSTNFHGRA